MTTQSSPTDPPDRLAELRARLYAPPQPDPAAVRAQLTHAREADADPRANVAGELARLTRELREMTEKRGRCLRLAERTAILLRDAQATAATALEQRDAARANAELLGRTLIKIRGWAAMPLA